MGRHVCILTYSFHLSYKVVITQVILFCKEVMGKRRRGAFNGCTYSFIRNVYFPTIYPNFYTNSL